MGKGVGDRVLLIPCVTVPENVGNDVGLDTIVVGERVLLAPTVVVLRQIASSRMS